MQPHQLTITRDLLIGGVGWPYLRTHNNMGNCHRIETICLCPEAASSGKLHCLLWMQQAQGIALLFEIRVQISPIAPCRLETATNVCYWDSKLHKQIMNLSKPATGVREVTGLDHNNHIWSNDAVAMFFAGN